jgi:predicted outer membrane protein
MKQKRNFNFLNVGILAPALVLLLMTPAALAQMHTPAPMGGTPSSGMNNNNNNMSPDGMNGMQPGGPTAPENNQDMIERSTFGNLRRNFDVETHLSKMALKHSNNEDVKKFATQVIGENHGLSNDLIVPNPNGQMMMGPEMVPSVTRKAEKQMKKMTGKPFDELYLVQMDAYVKNDQQTAHNAEAMTSLPKMSEVGMRVRTMSDQREQQIADLTKKVGFVIK